MEQISMEKLSLNDQSTQPATPKHNKRKIQLDDLNILSKLGKGNYANVFAAQKKGTENVYALKCIQKSRIKKLDKKHYIKNEREILLKIDHQFLTKCHFSFQNQKELFFALDYCEGGDFYEFLSKVRKIDEDQCMFYICQLILAIQHLHSKNIIHRDLKLENILLDSDGYVKLTDFGLSQLNISGNTGATSFCGTPFYMAAEMVRKESYGKAVDWWAIGILIFEMLTGNPPHHLSKTKDLYEKIKYEEIVYPSYIKGACKDLLQQLLKKDPKERLGYNGAEEIMNHQWFKKVNWNRLQNREISAPFVPQNASFQLKFDDSDNTPKGRKESELERGSQYYSQFSIDRSDNNKNIFRGEDKQIAFNRIEGGRRSL